MTRQELETLFSEGTLLKQQQGVREFLLSKNSSRDYHFLANHIQRLSAVQPQQDRIAILSSFTFDQLKDVLSVELFTRGIGAEMFVAGFNQYSQEVLNSGSDLYRFEPSAVIMALRTEELFEDFHWAFKTLNPQELEAERHRILELFRSLIKSLRENSDASIFINNFAQPPTLATGIHDSQDGGGQLEWIRKTNSALVKLTGSFPDTHIFDLDRNMQEFGLLNALDPKMWYNASIPYTKAFIRYLAGQYAQYIYSSHGRKKCLVLDLDNTLWGGIIGEDGIDNIDLGKTYPGNVFVDIQHLIKRYAQQGVILALNSKNNETDVREVFENHPDIVLQWDDFAAVRINWEPKPQNMVELAEEINIGLDSMVFVDDSPFETQMVKDSFPEVEILRLLGGLEYFNLLDLTTEDLKKSDQYKAQARRTRMKSSVVNIEDFYRGLEMKVKIRECDNFARKRVSQMTQKTNQFNLTTQRYTETDIQSFCDSESHHVYTISVADKYGDNGITGVLIAVGQADSWKIDTFLLSCRIMGRTIETALLSHVVAQARKHSIKRIIGEYIPTAKNIPVKDLYKNHGFTEVETGWVLETTSDIATPAWIELIDHD